MKLLVYVQVYKGSWDGEQIQTLGTNKNMLLRCARITTCIIHLVSPLVVTGQYDTVLIPLICLVKAKTWVIRLYHSWPALQKPVFRIHSTALS